MQTPHFLQAARWSFARLGMLGILGILGLGLVSACKQPAQTAFCAAPNKKTVFIVFLVFSVAAHHKARAPQTVYRTGVARKPQGFSLQTRRTRSPQTARVLFANAAHQISQTCPTSPTCPTKCRPQKPASRIRYYGCCRQATPEYAPASNRKERKLRFDCDGIRTFFDDQHG